MRTILIILFLSSASFADEVVKVECAKYEYVKLVPRQYIPTCSNLKVCPKGYEQTKDDGIIKCMVKK